MMNRRAVWVTCLLILARPAFLPAQDPKPAEPTLIVRLAATDTQLANAKYFAALVGQDNLADQLDGIIGAWAGPAGLAGSGIDVKRPFYAYAVAAAETQDSPLALLLPVADEDTFLKFLESFPIKVVRGDDPFFAIEYPNQPVRVYFRFANGYAYFTAMKRGHIELHQLVAPEKLAAADPTTALSVSLRIDHIPDMTKQMLLGQIELRLADVKDRRVDGEAKEQAEARRRAIDAASEALKRVLSEGRSAEIALAIDRDKDTFGLQVALDGKPNTLMNTAVSALAGGKSRFKPAPGSALHVGLNFAVPDAFRGLLGFAVDGLTRDAVAKELDPAKRELAAKVSKAVGPTLKAGQVDLHVVAAASADNQMSLLAALGVRDGKALEGVVKDLVEQLPESERGRIHLDDATVGSLNLHRVAVEPGHLDANARRLLGDHVNVWAGFSPNAVMLGLGGDAAATVGGLAAGESAERGPLIVIEGSIARLAALDPKAAKVAQRVFGRLPSAGDGFRISLEGGDKLKLALNFHGRALRFFSLMNEVNEGRAEP
jgi:hypothetical protein